MNKKGAEFTVNTLIVIVLAIIVLVVLALGFGAGWTNLWSKITGYFSPVNVDATKQACQYACSTQASYDYCCRIREVKFEKDGEKEFMTCNSDIRIKPSECDLNCDVKTQCASLLCLESVGVIEEAKCKTPDTSKKFDKDGIIITKGNVCCKELKPSPASSGAAQA